MMQPAAILQINPLRFLFNPREFLAAAIIVIALGAISYALIRSPSDVANYESLEGYVTTAGTLGTLVLILLGLTGVILWNYEFIASTTIGSGIALLLGVTAIYALYRGYRLVYRMYRYGGFGANTWLVRVILSASLLPVAVIHVSRLTQALWFPSSTHPVVATIPGPGAATAGITMRLLWVFFPPLIAVTIVYWSFHAAAADRITVESDYNIPE